MIKREPNHIRRGAEIENLIIQVSSVRAPRLRGFLFLVLFQFDQGKSVLFYVNVIKWWKSLGVWSNDWLLQRFRWRKFDWICQLYSCNRARNDLIVFLGNFSPKIHLGKLDSWLAVDSYHHQTIGFSILFTKFYHNFVKSAIKLALCIWIWNCWKIYLHFSLGFVLE